MSKYVDENENMQAVSANENGELQSALEDAEQALAGDPLQEAVKQKNLINDDERSHIDLYGFSF